MMKNRCSYRLQLLQTLFYILAAADKYSYLKMQQSVHFEEKI